MGSTQRTEDMRLQEAATWWARLQEGEPDAQELTAWIAWMESDKANPDAFESLNDLALRIRHTRTVAPERINGLERAASRGTRRWPALTIAASVVAIMACVSIWTFGHLGSARTVGHDGVPAVFSTPTAGLREVLLPDGSRVALGGASRIDIDFSTQSRNVHLREGEAYFEVKHESTGRPFVVDVGLATVHAVGTAFNIRKSDGRVDVTVTEGRVKVIKAEGTLRRIAAAAGLEREQVLEVGRAEQVAIEPRSVPFAVSSVDPQRATSWREGRLEFVDEPLDAVIQSVSRYASKPLVSEDPRLHSITYTGTFVPEKLDSWLDALQTVFPVEAIDGGNALKIRMRVRP